MSGRSLFINESDHVECKVFLSLFSGLLHPLYFVTNYEFLLTEAFASDFIRILGPEAIHDSKPMTVVLSTPILLFLLFQTSSKAKFCLTKFSFLC